jgi:hypothetical protein
MKNFWAQRETATAAWHADVTPILGSPEKLVELVRSVYEAAAQTRLILPVGVDPQATVTRRWESERTVDLFWMIRNSRVEADLSWYDVSDLLVQGRVADLGELLASLQPAPNAIYSHNRAPGEPPVALTGGQIAYTGSRVTRARGYPETFSVTLHSDIWFSYVIGDAHPARDLERFFDNRELAHCNTPRLNQLLGTIARLVTEAGGRWYFDKDDFNAQYAPWLSDQGIQIDGLTPPLMDVSAVDVEWPTLEE